MGKQIYITEEEEFQLILLIDNVIHGTDLSEEQDHLYRRLLEKLRK